MRAGILVRLSEAKDTELKTEEAFERFEQSCRRLCEQRDWEVTEPVLKEGVVSAFSGKERKVFDAATKALSDGEIDVLVIPNVERMIRRPKEAYIVDEIIEQTGRDVVTANGYSARDDDTWPILVGLGISESRRIRRRVKAQIEQAAAKGRPHSGGRRPFGYTKRGGEVIEAEAAVLRECARRIIDGKTLREVTTWANTVSVTTLGNPWQQQTLGPALKSPHIAGLRTHNGQKFAGTWEPVIDRATWEAMTAVLNNPARKRGGRPSSRLLSGVVVCGKCGAVMWAHHRAAKRGGQPEYLCPKAPGRKGCGGMAVSAVPLEDAVTRIIIEDRWFHAGEDDSKGEPGSPLAVGSEVNELEQQLTQLGTDFGSGRVSYPAFLAADTTLRMRLGDARAELDKAVMAKGIVRLQVVQSVEEARQTWAVMDTSERRNIVKMMFGTIVVMPSTKPGRTFDPSRVPQLQEWAEAE